MSLNTKYFPCAYTNNKKVKSLKIIGEVRKGIYNGPGRILVNGRNVCETKFMD